MFKRQMLVAGVMAGALGMAASQSQAELVHYWDFNETTGLTATDSVNGLNLALSGYSGDDSQWVAGASGGGLHFNGTSQYGRNIAGPGPNEGAGLGTQSSEDLSISVWVKHDSLVGNQRYVGWGGQDGDWRRIYFGWTASGSNMTAALGASNDVARATTENPSLDWVMYTMVYDATAGTTAIYENGVQLGTTGTLGARPSQLAYAVSSTMGFNVGKNYDAAGAYFAGSMDDLAIFNHALTSNEVAAIYSNGVPEPSSLALIGLGGLMVLRRRK